MKNHQVLIIDNNKKDGKYLASLLQNAGHFPQIASGRKQGITLINERPIAVVVLDHASLGDSEIEIIQEITEIDSDLQLIIYTRDKSFDSAIEALRRRVVDYLIKPCSDAQILGAVELALALRIKQLRRVQYFEQVDYLWTRIKHLDKIDIDDFDRDEAFEARFFPVSPSTMVDLEQQTVLHKDKTIPLNLADFRLLLVFLNNPRQILTFQDIILMKDNMELPPEEAQAKLRPMIHRLRLRLSDIPEAKEWIENVRGTGYIFNL